MAIDAEDVHGVFRREAGRVGDDDEVVVVLRARLGPGVVRARHYHRIVTERGEHDDLAVYHHAVELDGLVEPASAPLQPRRQPDPQPLAGKPLALVRTPA